MCYGCNFYGYNSSLMNIAFAFGCLSSAINSLKSVHGGSRNSSVGIDLNSAGGNAVQSNLVGDLLLNSLNSPSSSSGISGGALSGLAGNGYTGMPPFDTMSNPFGSDTGLGLGSMSANNANEVARQKIELMNSIYGYDPTRASRLGLSEGGNNGSLFSNITGGASGRSKLPDWYGTPIMYPATELPSLANIPSTAGLADLIGPQLTNPYSIQSVQADDNTEGNSNSNTERTNIQSRQNLRTNNNSGRQQVSSAQSGRQVQQSRKPSQNVLVDKNNKSSVVLNRKTGTVTIGQDVMNKVNEIAAAVKCNPLDLLGVIYMESTFKTVPDKWDGKHAVGLIQWTDIALKDLRQNCGVNYTKADIAKMNVMQQLELAKITLLREKRVAGFSDNHVLTAAELYAINYCPRGAKNPSCVARKGDGNYEGNEGLDIDGNGVITHQELATRVNRGRSHIAMA